QLSRMPKTPGGLAYLSNAMLTLLNRAEKEAIGSHPASGGPTDDVGVENLLNALSQELRGPAAAVLQVFGLGPGSFRPPMAALKNGSRGKVGGGRGGFGRFPFGLVARGKKGGFDSVIGPDLEVPRLLQILERRQKKSSPFGGRSRRGQGR